MHMGGDLLWTSAEKRRRRGDKRRDIHMNGHTRKQDERRISALLTHETNVAT